MWCDGLQDDDKCLFRQPIDCNKSDTRTETHNRPGIYGHSAAEMLGTLLDASAAVCRWKTQSWKRKFTHTDMRVRLVWCNFLPCISSRQSSVTRQHLVLLANKATFIFSTFNTVWHNFKHCIDTTWRLRHTPWQNQHHVCEIWLSLCFFWLLSFFGNSKCLNVLQWRPN